MPEPLTLSEIDLLLSAFPSKIQSFIHAFNGNVAGTAKKVGISKQYAYQIAKRPDVVRVIQGRKTAVNVLDRTGRQVFWTCIIQNKLVDKGGKKVEVTVDQRLKASELLGRSQMDFTEATPLGKIADKIQIVNYNGAEQGKRLQNTANKARVIDDNSSKL